MNALQLRTDNFHTKKLYTRLSSTGVRFSLRKYAVLHSPDPLCNTKGQHTPLTLDSLKST